LSLAADVPPEIAPRELAGWRADGRDVVVLDVREPWEVAICCLPGSTVIRMAELPARTHELPRDVPLVVLCHHGVRSRNATQWLREAGFRNACNLSGGIDAWARAVRVRTEVRRVE